MRKAPRQVTQMNKQMLYNGEMVGRWRIEQSLTFCFTAAAVRTWAHCCLDLHFSSSSFKNIFFKLDSYKRLCIKYTWIIKHTRNKGTPLNPQLKSHIINAVRVSCVTLPSHMHPPSSAVTPLSWVFIIPLLFFIVLLNGFISQNNLLFDLYIDKEASTKMFITTLFVLAGKKN